MDKAIHSLNQSPLHQPQDVVGDRYEILAPLGQGGIGLTYTAMDRHSGTSVALKVLSLRQMTEWKALELFEREAQVLEAIHHPQVPAYIDHFQVDTPGDRRFYLVQELAPGQSLAEWVAAGGRASLAEVCDIATQVLEILNYLHQLTPPVIHRDIKPQNVVRRADGQIYLVDFGAVQTVYRDTLAAGRTMVGTFGYMPPEQFRGQASFGSDLYSLGATLLFLLTHRDPADLPQQRLKIQFRDRVQLPPNFANWLDRILEPVLDDRFPTAWAALMTLEQAMSAFNEAQLESRQLPKSLPQAVPSSTPNLVPKPSKSRSTPLGDFSAHSGNSPRRRKPAGSLVFVDRTVETCTIDIPPNGATQDPIAQLARAAQPLGLAVLCVGLAWGSGTLLGWAGGGSLAAGAVGGSLIAVATAMGFGKLGRVLFQWAGWTHVQGDRHRLIVGWSCLGYRRQVQCPWAAITNIAVQVTISPTSGARRSRLVIWRGDQPLYLGDHLSEVEQEWLAAELREFGQVDEAL
jgi:eukaryotic-like serine/threonine-protein kinase